MRNAFARSLRRLADDDPRVILLSGDIGNRMFDDYKADFPERFYNCGIAEANMTGVAAGLAIQGYRPFSYTITPFVTTRCLEQIRVDVCYHRLPVTIVGVGGGLAYASLGATHHACEDIAMLRCIPDMQVICPADAHEVEAAVAAVLEQDKPAYIRLGKKNEPVLHASAPDFQIGKAIAMKPGQRVGILACGVFLDQALKAADILESAGVSTAVYSFHTVKPLDEACLKKAFTQYDLVVTLEEHSVLGGFGSAVAEWACDQALETISLLRIGTPDVFPHTAVQREQIWQEWGLTPAQIASQIQTRLL